MSMRPRLVAAAKVKTEQAWGTLPVLGQTLCICMCTCICILYMYMYMYMYVYMYMYLHV